jgi:hypothetical protein
MFACIIDFKVSTAFLEPSQTIGLLNESVNIFDNITDKFDAFRVKTKLDASYMIVAGLDNRSNVIQDGLGSKIVNNIV